MRPLESLSIMEGRIMSYPVEPIPGNPIPPVPPPAEPVPPIGEPEPERLPDEIPNPNPDENDRPEKWLAT